MQIDKRFIWSDTLDDFKARLEAGDIDNESIAFIGTGSDKQIWTQGQYFPCPYTKDEINDLITGGEVDLSGYLTKASAESTYLKQSAYTANDVLTKLKTVDGSDSGLDADTLDGKQANSFLSIYNKNISSSPTSGGRYMRILTATVQDTSTLGTQISFSWYPSEIDTAKHGDFSVAVRSPEDLYFYGLWKGTSSYNMWVIHDGDKTFEVWLDRVSTGYLAFGIIQITSVKNISSYEVATQFADELPSGTTEPLTIGGIVYSANQLANARNINGTSFNGTGDITTNSWGTSRTITIGNAGKSINGSQNVSYSLTEIGAAPVSHTHTLAQLSDLNTAWTSLLLDSPTSYVTRWPSWSEVTNKPTFSTVATSGSYNDLTNKPAAYTLLAATTTRLGGIKVGDGLEVESDGTLNCTIDPGSGTVSWGNIQGKPSFATVATTGSYNDLLNKPSLSGYATQEWCNNNFISTTSGGTIGDDSSGIYQLLSSTQQVLHGHNNYNSEDADWSISSVPWEINMSEVFDSTTRRLILNPQTGIQFINTKQYITVNSNQSTTKVFNTNGGLTDLTDYISKDNLVIYNFDTDSKFVVKSSGYQAMTCEALGSDRTHLYLVKSGTAYYLCYQGATSGQYYNIECQDTGFKTNFPTFSSFYDNYIEDNPLTPYFAYLHPGVYIINGEYYYCTGSGNMLTAIDDPSQYSVNKELVSGIISRINTVNIGDSAIDQARLLASSQASNDVETDVIPHKIPNIMYYQEGLFLQPVDNTSQVTMLLPGQLQIQQPSTGGLVDITYNHIVLQTSTNNTTTEINANGITTNAIKLVNGNSNQFLMSNGSTKSTSQFCNTLDSTNYFSKFKDTTLYSFPTDTVVKKLMNIDTYSCLYVISFQAPYPANHYYIEDDGFTSKVPVTNVMVNGTPGYCRAIMILPNTDYSSDMITNDSWTLKND